MIEVFIEYKSHTELIAKFETEELYMVCVAALEAYCKEHGGVLTEREVVA